MMSKHSIVSLFSGCGGLDLGFKGGFKYLDTYYQELPFEFLWANEINSQAARTYQRNLKHPVCIGDIKYCLNLLPEYADLVIGGSPCQDFSVLNQNGKGKAGIKSSAYVYMIEAVNRLKPKAFVLENVAGLAERYASDLNEIINDFAALDYKIVSRVLNACDYGVPQTRRRLFVVGLKKVPIFESRVFEFSEPPFINRKWRTVKDAISDLEPLTECFATSHIWSNAKLSGDTGSRKLKADLPAPTVTSGLHGKAPFHYRLPRRVSNRELARLQSFPDNFDFQNRSRTEIEKQIGNAVPPVLAWHLAKDIVSALQAPNRFKNWNFNYAN